MAAALARDRAMISDRVAVGLLGDLAIVAARIAGYEVMLGTEAVAAAKGRIGTLRATLEPLASGAASREIRARARDASAALAELG